MTERPHRGSPHSFRVSESNCLRDGLNRLIGLFNSRARSLNPKPLGGFSTSLSCLGQEHSSELAGELSLTAFAIRSTERASPRIAFDLDLWILLLQEARRTQVRSCP